VGSVGAATRRGGVVDIVGKSVSGSRNRMSK
jgi:hypothetical protein